MDIDFARLIPLWISLLGAPHQAPHFVRLLFLDPPQRHRQHHAQRQPAPQLHFAHAPNRMQLKPERDVHSAVDSFDSRPLVVFFSPFVAGAVYRGKDPPLFRQRDAYPLRHRALCPSLALDAILLSRASLLR